MATEIVEEVDEEISTTSRCFPCNQLQWKLPKGSYRLTIERQSSGWSGYQTAEVCLTRRGWSNNEMRFDLNTDAPTAGILLR